MYIDNKNRLVFSMGDPHRKHNGNYLPERGRTIKNHILGWGCLASLITLVGFVGSSNRNMAADSLYDRAEEVREGLKRGYLTDPRDYQIDFDSALAQHQRDALRSPNERFSDAQVLELQTELDATNVFNLSRPLKRTE